ncbi:hypothetical protein L227DRAFT_618104 [Lentinus tigrinus ALCF2SS1-6]|uniref:Uncharacterized protein n=1 Tax=Lentinus tigrinus ALCF2SS1-6 TaxID=1328759 RepID=A0A5C2RLX3_9APHY|nr:hypothetical protein L227DRAFT_618104 [Lentinus tigrinus ALCF2SS1-6]
MRVEAKAHRPPRGRVNTAPIAIVNIRLREFEDAGSPARAMHSVLLGYYCSTRPDDLVYIDAPYAITNTQAADLFRAGLETRLQVLDKLPGARVFIFVLTHSEESSGDLFWDSGLSSDSLNDWWKRMIPDKLMMAGAKHDVTVALLSCGSLVEISTQRETLKMLAQGMQVQRVIAFGAHAVQAYFTSSFFTCYATTILIEGVFLNDTHFARLLQASPLLTRHSSVLLFTRQDSSKGLLHVKEFRWGHPTIQPYGNALPLQCPMCGRIYTWAFKAGKNGEQRVRCNGPGCGYSFQYTKGADQIPIRSGELGTWFMRYL